MNARLFLRIGLLLLLICLLVVAGLFDLQSYLTLDFLRDNLQGLRIFYQERPLAMIVLFMGIYIVVTACSIPGATILTLGAGALFGRWMGSLLVSFASTIGATLAFLIARFFFAGFCAEKVCVKAQGR